MSPRAENSFSRAHSLPEGRRRRRNVGRMGKRAATAAAAAADANVIWIQAEAVLILLRRENDTPSRTYPARLLCGLKANETARTAPNNIQSARARAQEWAPVNFFSVDDDDDIDRRHLAFHPAPLPSTDTRVFFSGEIISGIWYYDGTILPFSFLFPEFRSIAPIDRPTLKDGACYKPLLQGSAHKVWRVYWREGMSKEAGDYIDPIRRAARHRSKTARATRRNGGGGRENVHMCVCVYIIRPLFRIVIYYTTYSPSGSSPYAIESCPRCRWPRIIDVSPP